MIHRLRKEEISALRIALKAIPYPVYLFGSKTDISKSGGDVDILIFSDDLDEKQRFDLSIQVAVAFKKTCDEKIDVVVFNRNHLSEDDELFLNAISKKVKIWDTKDGTTSSILETFSDTSV